MKEIKLTIIDSPDLKFYEQIPECDNLVYERKTGLLKVYKDNELQKTFTNFAYPNKSNIPQDIENPRAEEKRKYKCEPCLDTGCHICRTFTLQEILEEVEKLERKRIKYRDTSYEVENANGYNQALDAVIAIIKARL